jgi:hypothetical protein
VFGRTFSVAVTVLFVLSMIMLNAMFLVRFKMSVRAASNLITMTATIRGTWWFDIDTGQNDAYPNPATTAGDLWWEQAN